MESDSASSFANAMEARLWCVASRKFGVAPPASAAAKIAAIALVPEKPLKGRKRRRPADHSSSQPVACVATNVQNNETPKLAHSQSECLLQSPPAACATILDDFASPLVQSNISLSQPKQISDMFDSDAELYPSGRFATDSSHDTGSCFKTECLDGFEDFLLSPTPQRQRILTVGTQSTLFEFSSDDENADVFAESPIPDHSNRASANLEDLLHLLSEEDESAENRAEIRNDLEEKEENDLDDAQKLLEKAILQFS